MTVTACRGIQPAPFTHALNASDPERWRAQQIKHQAQLIGPKLQRAWDGLGDDVLGVAATLMEHEIQGARLSSVDCPVARFLHFRTGYVVAVSETRTGVFAPGVRAWFDYDTPPPVAGFLSLFDGGAWASLWNGETMT